MGQGPVAEVEGQHGAPLYVNWPISVGASGKLPYSVEYPKPSGNSPDLNPGTSSLESRSIPIVLVANSEADPPTVPSLTPKPVNGWAGAASPQ